jgi:hypothetical protein
MSDIQLEIVAQSLLKIIEELPYANSSQLQVFQGRLGEVKNILKLAKIEPATMVMALENIGFVTELSKKLLQ